MVIVPVEAVVIEEVGQVIVDCGGGGSGGGGSCIMIIITRSSNGNSTIITGLFIIYCPVLCPHHSLALALFLLFGAFDVTVSFCDLQDFQFWACLLSNPPISSFLYSTIVSGCVSVKWFLNTDFRVWILYVLHYFYHAILCPLLSSNDGSYLPFLVLLKNWSRRS